MEILHPDPGAQNKTVFDTSKYPDPSNTDPDPP